MSSAGCPSEDDLLAFANGLLPREQLRSIENHLDGCAMCRPLVIEAARDLRASSMGSAIGDPTPDVDVEADGGADELPAPVPHIGRYTILELAGYGAMGAVYAAYDPQLDRRVALKLLRSAHGGTTEALEARLLREGQAMARLSHPNVVAVHDVGSDGGRVFLAMEYVEGETLRQWLARARPTWRRILDVFVEAGRGLAAAHRAGIVHRDFKPENVLIDGEGRVRVTDFGLARAAESIAADVGGSPAVQSPSLTGTGALVGTPAYMAPEQLRGENAGPAADVFAFSTALYQSLYGQHPFSDGGVDDLRAAMEEREAREPRGSSPVPARVRRALLRGLRRDPAERFASMPELLAALAPPRFRLARLALVGAAGAALAAGLWAGTADEATDPCTGGAEHVAARWNDARRAAIRERFLSTGAAYAQASFASAGQVLDDFGSRWAAAHRSACAATHVTHEQSPDLLDRRMVCLDDRLREFGAIVQTLEEADQEMVARAPLAVRSLHPIESCSDRRELLAAVAEPAGAEARAKVAAARERIARAGALRRAGRAAEGLASFEGALDSIRALDYQPVEAQALLELGLLQYGAGKSEPAEKTLAEAARVAARAGTARLGVEAKVELAHLLGIRGEVEEAVRWTTVAQSEAERLGDEFLRAHAMGTRGMVHLRTKPEEAQPLLEEAARLKEASLGPDHPTVANALERTGAAYLELGRIAEARSWFERALVIHQRAYGPDHPDVAATLANLSNAVGMQGRRREALGLAERALAIFERSVPPEHPRLLGARVIAGIAQAQLGHYREAVDRLEASVAVHERLLGRDHPELMSFLVNLCEMRPQLGDLERSKAACSRARAQAEKFLGKDDPLIAVLEASVGIALERDGQEREACERYDAASRHITRVAPDYSDMGWFLELQASCLLRAGRAAAARALFERSLAMTEAVYGKDNPSSGSVLIGVGSARLDDGDRAGARAAFARAVELCEPGDCDALTLAEARLGLARSLDPARPEADRAALISQARDVILSSPYAGPDLVKRARAAR